ncbi:hypothetical protein GF366_00015 [Candidatus Peregrinibacteria bacterium]|nr:hypothetical protein [Candidatus Peregrinibacteria bacterium]
MVLIDGRAFDKEKFLNFVKQSLENGENTSEALSKSEFLFKAELFELKEKLGNHEAMNRHETAKHRYENLINELEKMKKRGVSRKEIYDYLIQFQGAYEEESSFVINLLYKGVGNCEARAKLMIMALKDIFGDEIEIKINLVDYKNVDKKEITPHISVLVKDDGVNYSLELPGAEIISDEDFEKTAVFEGDVFEKSYMAEEGVEEYEDYNPEKSRKSGNKTDNPPSPSNEGYKVKSTKSDSIFKFPKSSDVVEVSEVEVDDADPEKIFELDDNSITAYLVPQSKKEKTEKESDEKTESDTRGSDITYLDEKSAKDLISNAEGKEDKIDLSNLENVDNKTLKVLSNFKGLKLRIKVDNLNPEKAQILSSFKVGYLVIEGDLSPASARELASFGGEGLEIYGKANKEAIKKLSKVKGDLFINGRSISK